MARISYGTHTYGKIDVIGGKRFGRVVIGKYCSIAGEVKAFLDDNHNIEVISSYPFFHPRMPITRHITTPKLPHTQHYNVKKGAIIVGNDVWIGYGAILFKGITIGDGVCVGAFTTVTKDIPPYSVVVGHSRIVRKRFSQEDIDFLLALKWWDFEDEVVGEIAPILHTPDVSLLRQWAMEKGKI